MLENKGVNLTTVDGRLPTLSQYGQNDNPVYDTSAARRYQLSLHIQVVMNDVMVSCTSPSHALDLSLCGDSITTEVTLARKTCVMDKDFVLLIASRVSDTPKCFIQKSQTTDSWTAVLTMVPDFQAPVVVRPMGGRVCRRSIRQHGRRACPTSEKPLTSSYGPFLPPFTSTSSALVATTPFSFRKVCPSIERI